MNCRDFDQVWNQLLDSRGRDEGDRERRLREHAEACPSCLARHRRFEALRGAIEAWAARPNASPSPTPGLAERVVEIAARPGGIIRGPARPRFARPRLAGLALAASAAAAALLLAVGPRSLPEPSRPVADAGRPIDRGLFGGAVSDATAASWQLALLATEPAARLGKEMIGESFRPESGSPEDEAPSSGFPAFDAESFPPDLIDQVSDALAAGVRPLSTSARRAFGFLRAPSPDKLNRPPVPPAAKGA